MRKIIFKDGITTDVPETELLRFLLAGYVVIGEKEDAPILPEVLPEEEAVNKAALAEVEAHGEFVKAQNELAAAKNPEPIVSHPAKVAKPIILEELIAVESKKKVGK